jgi:hypothetical protein
MALVGEGPATDPGMTRAIASDAYLSHWLAVKRDGIAPSKTGSGLIGIDTQTRKRVSKAVYMDWMGASKKEIDRHFGWRAFRFSAALAASTASNAVVETCSMS